MAAPLFTIIVPTYDHHSTVDIAVESALSQTLDSLEVVVIGDGATREVVEVVERLVAAEPRVRFVKEPPSIGRAELARHRIVAEAHSPYVAYLGDDDLLLPDHLAVMAEVLEKVDFAHPLPVYVRPDGRFSPHPTDIGRADARSWHLHPQRNAISLTGVAHRRAAYLDLPYGWGPAPAGRWSDHYMWQQWFAQDGLTFATSGTCTALKFPADARADMTADERRAELVSWRDRWAEPGFDRQVMSLSLEAFRDFAVDARLRLAKLEDDAEAKATALEHLAAERAQAAEATDALRRTLAEAVAHAGRLAADLERTISERNAALRELARRGTGLVEGGHVHS